MLSKTIFLTTLIIASIGVLATILNVPLTRAQGYETIRINPDGTVNPSSAPIQRNGDIYSVTSDITSTSILIERNDMILDGNGHKIQGSSIGIGIYSIGTSNVTIVNITMERFQRCIRLDLSNTWILSGILFMKSGEAVWLNASSNSVINSCSIETNSGITLSRAANSNSIYNCEISGCGNGILIGNSMNNSIIDCNLTNNQYGIYLSSAYNNTIFGNKMDMNSVGIKFWLSSNNNFSRNIVSNCIDHAIILEDSSYNKFWHNTFKNTNNFPEIWDIRATNNVWDDGYPSGGNYWLYPSEDVYSGPYQNLTGSDGIQDVPYWQDRYPLMAPFTTFYAGTWDNVAYGVDVISNSTVSSFQFNPNEGPFVRFNVTGDLGTVGFCRVTIPKSLLWVDDGWTIRVGDQQILNYTSIIDENNTYIYFTYNHSTKTVTIQGTHVIPEFPSEAILLLFMILSAILVALAKKRKYKNSSPIFL